MLTRDIFDAISPLECRYDVPKELRDILSENGFTRVKLEVELALVEELHMLGICSKADLEEIRLACSEVTAAEVHHEETREGGTKHDIKALVNCITNRVGDSAKRYVHWMLTSADVVDTANSMRYKRATKLLVGYFNELRAVIAELAEKEAATPMIGRTHGQHAVPTTVGFWLAGTVARLDQSIKILDNLSGELRGKMSGAIGSYNTMVLTPAIKDPLEFELHILDRLDLLPSSIATQIVPSEPLIRLLSELRIVMGVVADLANDIRQLQRTEIAEMGEEFAEGQVGSSAMPHKRNPISFENEVSVWKVLVAGLILPFLNQISEHQRDLTGSMASRMYGESFAYVGYAVKRMTGLMRRLWIDRERMQKNIQMTSGAIMAEALRTLLAEYGHPDGHGAALQLTKLAEKSKYNFYELIEQDPKLRPYLNQMTPDQQAILKDPTRYTGLSEDRARYVAKEPSVVETLK